MFDNYVVAKSSRAKTWAMITIAVSVLAHVVVVIALVIRGFWMVEQHEPPKEASLKISVLAKAPPPPPPKKGVRKKKTTTKKVPTTTKMKIVKATDVQPTKKAKIVATTDADDSDQPEGDPDGVEGGVTGGVPGGVVGGVLGSSGSGPPPPPPPPSAPKIVLQHVLDQQRISGEKRIVPSESDKLKIRRDDKSQIIASLKMCLNTGGTVSRVSVVRSSGYPAYDAKIKGKMRQWRYRPFKVNGKAVPVCTSVTFIYRQTN